MSKSVLVMDTPDKCIHCLLLNSEDECIVQDDDANFNASGSWDGSMKGCLLKEVPEEIHNEYYLDEYCDGYDDGWNTLRKIILGVYDYV